MNNIVHFQVNIDNPSTHLVSVECTLTDSNINGQKFYLPSWVPGSYMIRDFSKYLINLHAQADDKNINITQLDKTTWQLAPTTGAIIKIYYQLYCFDNTPRGAYISKDKVFIDSSRIFICPEGYENKQFMVNINKPAGTAYTNWQIKTNIPKIVSSYLDLIDYPIVMGNLLIFTFISQKIPHEIVFYSQIANKELIDFDALIADLSKICTGHIKFFNEFPDRNYIFFINISKNGYGGIEHSNSSVNLCAEDTLPRKNKEHFLVNKDKYNTLLSLLSHEYFHLWNVKRIKPKVFVQPNLRQENYTRQLWIFEGITSYLGEINLVASQVITVTEYLKVLGETITSVLQNLGRTKQTLEQSSFEAWTKFYKPDEHSPNMVVSYYTKGELVALCLDVLLIIKTAGKIKLKTIMQYIWQMYGKNKSGLEEGEFEQIASKISGIDLTEFFALALRTTQDLPIQDLLNQVGVKLRSKNCSDLLPIGIKIADPNTNIINTVLDDSPAQLAGICPLDEIVAINHVKISNLNSILGTKLEELLEPQNITVHVFRDNKLLEYTLIKNYDYEKTMQKYELELQTSKYQSIWLNNDNKL